MKIYDYNDGKVKDITDQQYDFIQEVIKHCGRMDAVLKDYPVPPEELAKWKDDTTFWPILEGHLTILVRSKGLSLEYAKEFLLDTLSGAKERTSEQMKAINATIKVLGAGVATRPGFSGKVTLSPDNTQFEFKEIPIDDKADGK